MVSNYGYTGYGANNTSLLGNNRQSGSYDSPSSLPYSNIANDPYFSNINSQTASASQAAQSASSPRAASAAPPAPKKSGGIGGFFKGIMNGATGMVKGLANPKNWLLIGGAIALTAVCPPAGLALAGVGVVMGGGKMMSGMASGDMEKAGEGFFGMGMSVAGGAAAKGASAGAAKAATAAKGSTAASTGTAAAGSAAKTGGIGAKLSGLGSKVKGWFGHGNKAATTPSAAATNVPTPPPLPTKPLTPPVTANAAAAKGGITPDALAAGKANLKPVNGGTVDVSKASTGLSDSARSADMANATASNTTKAGLWNRGKDMAHSAGGHFKNAGSQLKNEAVSLKNSPKGWFKEGWHAKRAIPKPELPKDAGFMARVKNTGGNVWANTKHQVVSNPVLTIGSGVALTHPFSGNDESSGGMVG